MSYFDSPKNRALWAKELEGLRKMKEIRNSGGESDKREFANADVNIERSRSSENVRGVVSDVNRIRTSYKQLLLEEAASVRKKKKHETAKVLSKDNDLDMKIPI